MPRLIGPALLALVLGAGCTADAPLAPLEQHGSVDVPPGSLRITTDTIRPGVDVIIEGAGFSPSANANMVMIGGKRASVMRASATRLTVRLSRDACVSTGKLPVEVTTDERTARTTHPVRAARRIDIPAGGGELVLDGGDLRCIELAEGRRYIVSVFNTSTSPASLAEFRLTGLAGAGASLATRRGSPDVQVLAQPLAGGADRREQAQDILPDSIRRALEMHRRVMTISREALAAALAPAAPRQSRTVSGDLAHGEVGEVLALKVPDLNSSSACASPLHIRARTVHAGRYGIVLEDVANSTAGRMDEQLQAIGRELDEVMWPIITENFGDPLAMDARLDANGRIFMLFTEAVNRFNGIAGFVIGCDFVSGGRYASSNQAEIFYARVPSGSESPEGWRRTMRATVIHELKHITSFAERYAQASPLEDSWLEESTARHAEELYARTFSGARWRGNTSYAESIHCELRPGDPACGGRPSGMIRHFDALARYLEGIETLSPLGPSVTSDYTFYGSGWAFTRWAMDRYASSESAFLRALTREGAVTGLANLEKQTGRSFAELLGWWSLAMAVDVRPGFTPLRDELRFPSWQLRDLFHGMRRDLGRGTVWTSGYPLTPRHVSFGSFVVEVPGLRGGSAAVFELGGPSMSSQLLELGARGGGAPPGTLRIGVARLD